MWDSLPPVTTIHANMNLPGIVDPHRINSMGLFSPNMWNSLATKETERSDLKNTSNTSSGSPQLCPSDAVGSALVVPQASTVVNGRLSEGILPRRRISSPPPTSSLFHLVGSENTVIEGGHHSESSFPIPYPTERAGVLGTSHAITQPSNAPYGGALVERRLTLSETLRPDNPSHPGAIEHPPGVHVGPTDDAAQILDRRFLETSPTHAWGDHPRGGADGASAAQPPNGGERPTLSVSEVTVRVRESGIFKAPPALEASSFEVVHASTASNATTTMSTYPAKVVEHSGSAAHRLFLSASSPLSAPPTLPAKQQGCVRSTPEEGVSPETAVKTATTTGEAPPTTGADTSSLRITRAEVRQVFEAFRARYESYQRYKSQCIEAYLGKVEQRVDQYLVSRFKPKKVADNVFSKAGDNILKMGAKLFRSATNSKKSGCTSMSGSSSSITTPKRSGHLVGSMSCFGCEEAPEMETQPDTTLPPGRPRRCLPAPSFSSTEEVLRWPMGALSPPYYTANVILPEYLDSRPDEVTLHAVLQNYPILLYVLKNVFSPPPPSLPTNDADGGPLKGSGAQGPTLPASPSCRASTAFAAFCPNVYDSEEHAAIRGKMIAPLVESIWREYLTPLEMRIQELLVVADQNVLPAFRQCEEPPSEEAASGDLLRVHRLERSLRKDLEYLVAIRRMDQAFLADRSGQAPGDSAKKAEAYGLSDHVPVYGLILSHLHRLEMEHRSVLELWAGPRSCSASALPESSILRMGSHSNLHPDACKGPESSRRGLY